jgi:hypothetical protein
MKVYEINEGQPAGGKHREYACLNNKRNDGSFLNSQTGRGLRSTTWKEIELYVFNPGAPRPDFFGLGLDRVCNQRARDIAEDILLQSGELLPVKVEGEDGQYHLYNCTTVIDVLDPDRSIWKYDKEEKTSQIAVPSFHAKRLEKASLFKFPGLGSLSGLYVVERTGDYRDGEFKALVEHHGLTGLRFDLLWADKEGPAQPRFIYEDHHPFEYRTADGQRLVFQKPKPLPRQPIRRSANRQKSVNKKRKRA